MNILKREKREKSNVRGNTGGQGVGVEEKEGRKKEKKTSVIWWNLPFQTSRLNRKLKQFE